MVEDLGGTQSLTLSRSDYYCVKDDSGCKRRGEQRTHRLWREGSARGAASEISRARRESSDSLDIIRGDDDDSGNDTSIGDLRETYEELMEVGQTRRRVA